MLQAVCALLLVSYSLLSQNVEIKDGSGKVILVFKEDKLVEASSGKVFVRVTGNTIFDGASGDSKDILLLITTEDIFSKKRTGYALNAAQNEAVFLIRNGRFFHKASKTLDDSVLLAFLERQSDGSVSLYKNATDTLLCRIPDGLTTGKLAAVFYYFLRKHELEKLIEKKNPQSRAPLQEETEEETYGSISRLWNTGLDEFVWDGTVFKRKWNSFDYEEWTFDGTTLKRLWYPGDEELVWDGQILKRKWYPSADEFEWNGTILRRRFGSQAEEFIIQGSIVKKYFGGSDRDEWQIDGNLPIPLIALVVFGLIGR